MRQAKDDWQQLWDYTREVAVAAARHQGVSGVDLPLDCMAWIMVRLKGDHFPLSPGEDEVLKRRVHNWMRRNVYKVRHTQKKEVSLDDPDASGMGTPLELVSPDPGPEEVAELADLMDRLLAPLPKLTTEQQILYVRHFLEGVPLIDLVEETERSANALWLAICRIRKRLKLLYAGEGLTEAEVAQYRNLFDRLHARHWRGS